MGILDIAAVHPYAFAPRYLPSIVNPKRDFPMRVVASIVFVVLSAVAAIAGAASPEPASEEQKTLYAIGLALSNSLAGFHLNEADLEMVKAGLTDGVQNRPPKVELQVYGPKIQELQQTRVAASAEKEKQAGKVYLNKAAAEKGARKTGSGLVYVPLKPGKGASPKATDTVKVHYHGALTNGTMFDSSVQRGEPVSFPLNQVVPCWMEGLQLMKVGGKARLVCPSDIAYGDRGRPPKIPPGATLVFEVELLEIAKEPAAAPGAPSKPQSQPQSRPKGK